MCKLDKAKALAQHRPLSRKISHRLAVRSTSAPGWLPEFNANFFVQTKRNFHEDPISFPEIQPNGGKTLHLAMLKNPLKKFCIWIKTRMT